MIVDGLIAIREQFIALLVQFQLLLRLDIRIEWFFSVEAAALSISDGLRIINGALLVAIALHSWWTALHDQLLRLDVFSEFNKFCRRGCVLFIATWSH